MNVPIRYRLTAWYAVVLLGALALFSGLIWFSLRQSLLRELDRDLESRAAQFQAYLIHEAAEGQAPDQLKDELEEFCQALPPASTLEVRGSDGFAFRYAADGAQRPGAHRQLRRQFESGKESEKVKFELDLSASLRAIRRTLELLQVLLFSLVPAVVLIASLGGAWLSRRALKPVDEMTLAARAIEIDNLSQRLPVPETGDELQRLTEVWNSMLARLESAVRALSQFVADALHELRTPLAVIRTSAELALRRARTPEGYRESLTDISAEAERLTQLVEDLLLLARTDAQASEMPRETLDPAELLAETADQMRGIAERKGIRIRAEGLDGVTVAVSANRAALRRVFLVLLDNAIKYSRSETEVVVSLASVSGMVQVSVRDFGAGIRAADRAHIFQRFYQADQSRQDGGFGLGLSLAQSIARAHGAEIEFESEEGRGSNFWLRLPAVTGTPAADLLFQMPASSPLSSRVTKA